MLHDDNFKKNIVQNVQRFLTWQLLSVAIRFRRLWKEQPVLTGMRTIGITVSGGDNIASATVDIDFPPVFTIATVSISRIVSFVEDEHIVAYRAGILNFRFRNAQGFDTQVDFPAGPNDSINALPAAVAHDQMTHVTMQVLANSGFTRGLCTAFHWQ
jgi:hypothetical protein